MRRVIVGIAVCLLVAFQLDAAGTTKKAAQKKQKPPCAADIGSCPDKGCGGQFDANLNRQKNILQNSSDATGKVKQMTLADMKNLENPENFEEGTPDDGSDRTELRSIGEGTKIRVAAYLLKAREEPGGETCNCFFHDPAQTDNHLVLVTKETVDTFPVTSTDTADDVLDEREHESITAEFTPRVRLDHNHPHPNFTAAVMEPLIEDTDQGALYVRVTGVLMFDSEHFLRNHLKRVNNWEIHPVLKMEICTKGTKCSATSDDGWQSIDDMQTE